MCSAGDLGSILGSGRSPGEGNGCPLQYSCLENSMDRGSWWATVHGVTKIQIQYIHICCAVLSHSVVSDSLRPYRLQPARLLYPWGFSRGEYWIGLPCPPPRDLPNPGIKPRSLAIQVDSLPSEPSRKPKNIGVGSLSLLQGIFLTQILNWVLLHFRWILYQLSFQGSPYAYIMG